MLNKLWSTPPLRSTLRPEYLPALPPIRRQETAPTFTVSRSTTVMALVCAAQQDKDQTLSEMQEALKTATPVGTGAAAGTGNEIGGA